MEDHGIVLADHDESDGLLRICYIKSIKSSLQLNNHHARAVVKKGFHVHIVNS